MPTINEGNLTFEFPAGWRATKLDNWSFYRNQFTRLSAVRSPCSKCENQNSVGIKAVDILAIDANRCCWTIEAKDYRTRSRTKVIDVADEMATKVVHSLAMLAAACSNANDTDERTQARVAVRCLQIRIVLHLEQGQQPLLRRINLANVQQRLKQLVKAIDPHPLVVDLSTVKNRVGWTVASMAV